MNESDRKLFTLHCRSCSYAQNYQGIPGIVYCELHYTRLNNMSCCDNYQPQTPPVVIEINRILDEGTSNLVKITEIFNLMCRLSESKSISSSIEKHLAENYINGKVELKYLTKE